MIILHILENTHIIFHIREKYCSNNWADLSKWMTHMKASHIYIKKSLWVSGSPEKENEIGSLHELKSFLTHDLQICSKIAFWKYSFGSHYCLLEATNCFLYLKTNMMVSLCLFCWKFQVFKSKPWSRVLKLLSGEYFSVKPYLTTTSAEL